MSVSAACYLKIFTAVTRNWHWKCSGCFEYCIAKKLVPVVKVFDWCRSSGTATHRSKAAHTTFDWVVRLLYIWDVWLEDWIS